MCLIQTQISKAHSVLNLNTQAKQSFTLFAINHKKKHGKLADRKIRRKPLRPGNCLKKDERNKSTKMFICLSLFVKKFPVNFHG